MRARRSKSQLNASSCAAFIVGIVGLSGVSAWTFTHPIKNETPRYGFKYTTYNNDFFIVGLCCVLILTLFVYFIIGSWERGTIRKRIEALSSANGEVTAEEFLRTRGMMVGHRILSDEEFSGVYILINKTKNKSYVGQGKRVLDRINQHLTGSGNGDVYVDYRNGDQFSIQTIPLSGSGYKTLDALERDTIQSYNAYDSGYNKTRGNRG